LTIFENLEKRDLLSFHRLKQEKQQIEKEKRINRLKI